MEVTNNTRLIDWGKLIKRWGDEELVREITPVFLADNRKRLERLKKAIKSEDAEQITASAHALKGAGRNFEAIRLFEAAGRMECAGKENNLNEAASLFDQLKSEIDNILEFLSQPDWIEIAKRR